MVKNHTFYKLMPLWWKKTLSVDKLINIGEYHTKRCPKCGKFELIDFSEVKPVFLRNKYSGKEPLDIIAYDGVPVHTFGYWKIVSERFVQWFHKCEFKGAVFYQADIIENVEKRKKIEGNYYVMQIVGRGRLDFKAMHLESMNQCDYCGAYIFETELCPLLNNQIYPTIIEPESWDGTDIFYNSVCTERFVDKILDSGLKGYKFNDFASQYVDFENKEYFWSRSRWKALARRKNSTKKTDEKQIGRKQIDKKKKEERKSDFYVSDLDDDVKKEISSMIKKGIDVFGIEDMEDGKKIAEIIDNAIIQILNTGKYLDKFEDLEEAAVTLGCLYGKALEVGYGWSWKEIGKTKEEAVYCVVSPDENWMTPCLKYIYSILKEENRGLDCENDITCLLLYNMIGNSLNSIPEKKFTVIC